MPNTKFGYALWAKFRSGKHEQCYSPTSKWIKGSDNRPKNRASLQARVRSIRTNNADTGYELDILWHEHDSGEYATVEITWNGPWEAPLDYISRAEEALERFEQAVSWSDRASDLREPENDDIEVATADNDNAPAQHEVQGEILLSDDSPELIELYWRNDMVEMGLREWQVAVGISQEGGWSPIRPIETHLRPLGFITEHEGQAMQRAGRSLFIMIDAEPGLSASVQMDLGILRRLTEFVGGGAFIVGRQGAFANAKRTMSPTPNLTSGSCLLNG
jgi:hypothetical protein